VIAIALEYLTIGNQLLTVSNLLRTIGRAGGLGRTPAQVLSQLLNMRKYERLRTGDKYRIEISWFTRYYSL